MPSNSGETARKTGVTKGKRTVTRKSVSHAGHGRLRNQSAQAEQSLVLQVASLAAKAFKLAVKAGQSSFTAGRTLLMSSSVDSGLMRESGAYLKDVRELAGLTQAELAEALHLSDQSLLAAVEKGTATLSFELILRLAALLARHDPVPFIIRFTRTYDPEIWGILERWGIGNIPVHFERERQFINIYRGHDSARKLSDSGFEKVLQFTRAAFEAALHFAAEQQRNEVKRNRRMKEGKPSAERKQRMKLTGSI